MKKSEYYRVPNDGGQDGHSEPKRRPTPRFMPKRGFGAWAITLWPLILHLFMTTGITVFVTWYLPERHFNVTERQPKVPLANGTSIQLSGYKPLQTDITTALSSAIVVLRLISAAWAHSLYWRGAFFLMDPAGPGLQKRDLELMLGHGVFTPRTYGKDNRTFNVGVILLVTLVAQIVSPILTGSISWIPSNEIARLRTNDNLTVDVWGTWSLDAWDRYVNDSTRREWTVRRAVGHINLAWGRGIEKDVMKRVIPSIAPVNKGSTIRNVTVPYFSVTALEWIPNPANTLSPEQLNITHIKSILSAYEDTMTPLQPGVGTLIPATRWSPTPFPSRSRISETRALILHTHNVTRGEACSKSNIEMFGDLPSTMGLVQLDNSCFGFAWVTYHAGAGVCNDCRVSSSTVQNHTALPLQDSAITTEALRLMADVSAILVNMNSITSPPITMGNIDDYVIGLLSRSYSAAWCSLTFTLNDKAQPLKSSYSPAFPTVQALVNMERVYWWLIMQILMTCSGAAFLWMQSSSECRLIGTTTLAALTLDATEANTVAGHERLKAGGLLKLKPQNGRLRVVVEANEGVSSSVSMNAVP